MPTAQIPTDNPFFSTATGKNRLDLGPRPAQSVHVQLSARHRPDLCQRRGTGHVGRDQRRPAPATISDGPTTEGPFNSASFPTFTNPVYSYPHGGASPAGCAITGGAFYNPTSATFPAAYVGKYFFSDLCSGWIYYISPSSPSTTIQFAVTLSNPVDLKVGPDGDLYYLARGTGSVGKFSYQTPPVTPGGLRILP